MNIGGEQKYAVRIQVNPDALASRGIGLDEVRTALANTSVNQPKGNLENAHQAVTLDTNDQLYDAKSFNDVIVAYRNGAPVRVKDVGGAIDSVATNRVGAWFNDKPAELLLVQRTPGANTVDTVDRINALMEQLRPSIPGGGEDRPDVGPHRHHPCLGLRCALHVDPHDVPRGDGDLRLPAEFLGDGHPGDRRAACRSSARFAVMYGFGYSLDNLSLMGLTIAVGFVVDDAIVMIENIVRYIEEGDSPFDAALKGAGQIGFTIISITCSLIAVFIPLIFMGGIIGRLFREFAMTVAIAVVISAFISLTLTPVMCSLFLKHEDPHKRNRVSQWAEDAFDAIIRFYDRGLTWVLRHQFLTLLPTLALIVLTGRALRLHSKGLFPAAGHRLHLRRGRCAAGHVLRQHVAI